MGRQIIVQPDGRLAVWSSIVDQFVVLDATETEILAMDVAEFVERRSAEIKRKLEQLRADPPIIMKPFGMTWDEALDWLGEVHGEEEKQKLLDSMGGECAKSRDPAGVTATAAGKVAELFEVLDNRLLASDGPAGGSPLSMASPEELRFLYLASKRMAGQS